MRAIVRRIAMRVAALACMVAAACGSAASSPPGSSTSPHAPPASAAATASGAGADAGAPGDRTASDHAALARAVAAEIDLLRADPKAYAAHLRALRPRYDDKLLRLDGRDPIRTQEGRRPLDEAIRLLERTKRRGALRWEAGLARAASDHAAELGRRGELDHFSSNGDSPLDRVGRYGILQGPGGENIAVGFADARLVVVYLLIDDGVPDRGHRKAFLDPRYEQVGVGCGPHRRYRTVCVMDFAAGYASLVK